MIIGMSNTFVDSDNDPRTEGPVEAERDRLPDTRTAGASVNEALLEAFRHNVWATKQLLACCRGLSEEQLTSPAIGTFGGILATFNHIVRSDAGYARRMADGSGLAWVDQWDELVDLDQVDARAEETAQVWDRSSPSRSTASG